MIRQINVGAGLVPARIERSSMTECETSQFVDKKHTSLPSAIRAGTSPAPTTLDQLLIFRTIILILLLVVQPAVAFGQETGEQATRAVDFSLKDLKGKRARLADYRGKVVLINFWATWCVPCRAEMPDLVAWQNEYRDRGLQIIGITFPPYRSRSVRAAARQLKVNYPVLFGTREVAEIFDVSDVLPTTVVIDREGNIREQIKGVIDREEFDQKIKPLLRN